MRPFRRMKAPAGTCREKAGDSAGAEEDAGTVDDRHVLLLGLGTRCVVAERSREG
jgi:hypothetical protein